MATVEQIIGKINPKLYAVNGKDLLEKYGSTDKIPADEVKPRAVTVDSEKWGEDEKRKFFGDGIESSFKLSYDSSTEALEPVYFWIIEFMTYLGYKPEKLVDNFASTPGGTHFSESGLKLKAMQEEAMKIMGTINTVLRSTLNILYDLKEFKMRLSHYENLKSSNKETREAAELSLKQIWMDKVDIAKGNSSIKAMALGQAGFQTLIDAFLVVKNEKDVNNIDLNDRIKRILIPRITEFNIWTKESEGELRKRYTLEKEYLRSQVASLKIYSRWAKPYLIAANRLTMQEGRSRERDTGLVNLFNSVRFNLTLLGKVKLDPKALAISGDFPSELKDLYDPARKRREYNACVLVDLNFRAIPKQGITTGMVEATFKAYALNNDEIKALDKELEKDDMGEVMKLIETSTGSSMEQIQKEVQDLLDEKPEDKKEEEKKNSNDVNPFLALFGFYEGEKKPEDKAKKKEEKYLPVKADDYIEETIIRPYAAKTAMTGAFRVFDVYKKGRGMASYT